MTIKNDHRRLVSDALVEIVIAIDKYFENNEMETVIVPNLFLVYDRSHFSLNIQFLKEKK